jgi:hypothetical protein
MKCEVIIDGRPGVCGEFRDGIHIFELIDLPEDKNLIISYYFDNTFKLTISTDLTNIIICHNDNSHAIYLAREDLKQEYLDIFLYAQASIDFWGYFHSLYLLADVELEHFRCCKDLLEKIYEIYTVSRDIEAVKQSLCYHSNTKSARN